MCIRDRQLTLDAVEQKQEVQRLEAEAEISKAKHTVEAADQAWKDEAQQQQNSVAQQLVAADSRNRELAEVLGKQVCHHSVPFQGLSGLGLPVF